MKTIVTHIGPDLDALVSIWLIQKYSKGWEDAAIEFVPGGSTLDNLPVDSKPSVIHVDTGEGMFDHHQNKELTSASEKLLDNLLKKDLIPRKEKQPLTRFIKTVTRIDHFHESLIQNADDDLYDLLLNNVLDGLRNKLDSSQELILLSKNLFDNCLRIYIRKIKAEHEFKHSYSFTSAWGKSIAIESDSTEVIRLAQKKGISCVIFKHSMTKLARIKIRPDSPITLDSVHQILQKKDAKGIWFYHASGRMLINGTFANPNSKATSLSLKQIIDIVISIKH
jgi:hypothetical protein